MLRGMADRAQIPASALEAAVRAYGLRADSLKPLASGCYADCFRVASTGEDYVVRVRAKCAAPAEVVFAGRWARAVVAEVPVPVPLPPPGEVPTVQGRCVDIAPYIEHDDTHGHEASPDAWMKVGYWVGCLHRLGLPLAASAPTDLPYGNYPGRLLTQIRLDKARAQVPSEWRPELAQAEALLATTQERLGKMLPVLPHGVVHGDMHFWNVLYVRHEPVAIVDLDFLQRGYLLADVAYACVWLTFWDRDRGGLWRGIQDRYITAYEQGRQRALTDAERQCLPWARVMNALFFFLQNIVDSRGQAEWRGDLTEAQDLVRAIEHGLPPAT
jgi:Ser/Thr protein kinase RdoA (MazF antagonist)